MCNRWFDSIITQNTKQTSNDETKGEKNATRSLKDEDGEEKANEDDL